MARFRFKSPLCSPGVCVFDPASGWLCNRPLSEWFRLHKVTPGFIELDCFFTANGKQVISANGVRVCMYEPEDCWHTNHDLQIYSNSHEKICLAWDTPHGCQINVPGIIPEPDCFMTADLGQYVTSDSGNYCSDD